MSSYELGLPLDRLQERSKAVASRVRIWINKRIGAFNLGQLFTEPTTKEDGTIEEARFVWRLGNTEKHCSDCLALNGIVLTTSEWQSSGIRPQHPDLECGGWHCDCRLDSTEAQSDGLGAIR